MKMQVISTTTVTLNPAFLLEIKEDNRKLWSLMHEARASLTPASLRLALLGEVEELLRHWVDLLSDLRDQLATHFTLEEAYGYFDDPVLAAPRIANRADALRREHGDLYLQICDIVELSQQAVYGEGVRPRQIVQSFQSFDERFKNHESRENELIYEAFFDDLGVGD